jgi:hypothetical protein
MNDYLKELGRTADVIELVRIVRYMGAKRNDERGPKWQLSRQDELEWVRVGKEDRTSNAVERSSLTPRHVLV